MVSNWKPLHIKNCVRLDKKKQSHIIFEGYLVKKESVFVLCVIPEKNITRNSGGELS